MEWVWENGKSRGRGKCDWDVIYDKRIKEKDNKTNKNTNYLLIILYNLK